jgi:hypothetical protein
MYPFMDQIGIPVLAPTMPDIPGTFGSPAVVSLILENKNWDLRNMGKGLRTVLGLKAVHHNHDNRNSHSHWSHSIHSTCSSSCTICHSKWISSTSHVTNLPCPSSKQAVDGSVAALKRRTHDFMGQPRSSGDQQKTEDDDTGLSYLENVDKYEYDMLAIGKMITQ